MKGSHFENGSLFQDSTVFNLFIRWKLSWGAITALFFQKENRFQPIFGKRLSLRAVLENGSLFRGRAFIFVNMIIKKRTWLSPTKESRFSKFWLSFFLSVSLITSCSLSHSGAVAVVTWNNLKMFLSWWPWPSTFDLDLYTWPKYPFTWRTCRISGLYVCPFFEGSGNTLDDP